MTDELDLDHYEGARGEYSITTGSLCMAAYAFLAAERARPP